MVRRGRLELPWPIGHYDLNVARLPVPPPPPVGEVMANLGSLVKTQPHWFFNGEEVKRDYERPKRHPSPVLAHLPSFAS